MGINKQPVQGDSSHTQLRESVIGALLGLVLFVVPFSPVIGGLSAGYLTSREITTRIDNQADYGTDRTWVKAGGITGLIMFVPLAVAWIIVFVGVFWVGWPPFWLYLGYTLAGCLVIALYTVPLGAIGFRIGTTLHQYFNV